MNDTMVRYGQPVMLRIDKIINESDDTKTFLFKHNLNYKMGQFVMVWLPGIDEKPFAVSNYSDNFFGITALARGKFTKHLHNMNVGNQVGIRGPFGKGFSIPDSIKSGDGNACVIGGGCGMASLITLIEKLKHTISPLSNPSLPVTSPTRPSPTKSFWREPFARAQGEDFKDLNSTTPSSPPSQGGERGEVIILNGATTKSKLVFADRFKDMILITDDGSIGKKGYPTDMLEDLHKEHRFKIIYTCGPEIMMFKVFEFCKKNNIQCEASLERYMKCGIGICGQCVCDGQMVCKDGPVFNSQELSNMNDFGKYSLLKSGQKVTIKDYGEWREA